MTKSRKPSRPMKPLSQAALAAATGGGLASIPLGVYCEDWGTDDFRVKRLP